MNNIPKLSLEKLNVAKLTGLQDIKGGYASTKTVRIDGPCIHDVSLAGRGNESRTDRPGENQAI